MPTQILQSLILIFPLIMLACGAPEEFKGDQPSNTDRYTNPCMDRSLPDSDGDGANDECEAWMKTDPYKADTNGDGFSDRFDIPNWMTPEDQQTRLEQILADLANEYVLADSAAQGKAPDNWEVTVDEHSLYLVNESNVKTTHPEVRKVCEMKGQDFPYVYVIFQGSVCRLNSKGKCKLDTKVKTSMELCATGVNFSNPLGSLTATGNKTSVNDLVWNTGRVRGKEFFNPVLLKKDRTNALTTLEISVTGTNTKSGKPYVSTIDTKWVSTWKIVGVTTDFQDNPTGDTIELKKTKIGNKFKRFKITEVHDGIMGLLGPWQKDGFLWW